MEDNKNAEKLRRLKTYRRILQEKLDKPRPTNSKFDRKIVEQKLTFANNLIQEGEKGNFLNINKHLV